jgi:NtrC-family two-component system sensor histidine kinase KinB
VLTLTDVSERVRRLQLKEEFVATLTHDLKTPLAGADRMLELIASGGLCHIDEAGKKLIARLRHSNTKMLHLVQNLLETYRLESGVHWLHREEADLAALVRDCVEEMSPLADAAGLTLTCALEPTQANIDKASFYRVLANLMSNAIKFTPGGGAIEISGGTAGDAVVIRVRDTGRGIPQENSARIFQRFPRTDGKNGFQSSTGLGLYVCRQLVEAHGGTISFESEVGKGTTFTVKLPQAAQIASPEARHDAPQSTRRKNHDH